MEINYYSRPNKQIEVEKVYGEAAVEWMYESFGGKLLTPFLVKPLISKLYGAVQDSGISKKKVAPFINDFNINMDDFLPTEGRSDSDPYGTFNEFFIRRLKDGARKIESNPELMAAFSEARYYGYESVQPEETIPVKGKFLSPETLVGNDKYSDIFKEGPLLLARLCPVDYHRFHFPDNGKVIESYRCNGKLHSVNPLALKKYAPVLIENERQVTILETENFGKLAYIEVGAICVGKIKQSFHGTSFERGQEKGMFLFGGSTVIVVGEKGKWKPSQDILDYTQKGTEVYCQLGMPVAEVIK